MNVSIKDQLSLLIKLFLIISQILYHKYENHQIQDIILIKNNNKININ